MKDAVWVYRKSESNLYTVGFYSPDGKWMPESDHDDSEQAAARCHYLNGGCGHCEPDLLEALEALLADTECYCADNVADRTPCPVHQAQAAIAKAKGGAA